MEFPQAVQLIQLHKILVQKMKLISKNSEFHKSIHDNKRTIWLSKGITARGHTKFFFHQLTIFAFSKQLGMRQRIGKKASYITDFFCVKAKSPHNKIFLALHWDPSPSSSIASYKLYHMRKNTSDSNTDRHTRSIELKHFSLLFFAFSHTTVKHCAWFC